jgi:hypothetical protein
MNSRIRSCHMRLGGLGMLALLLLGSAAACRDADAGPDNLPIYTSPIDITGLRLQIRAIAPDRETGKPVGITLPPGLLGPKMKQLLAAPLSTQFDQLWNAAVRPKACEGKDGIKQRVADEVAKLGSSYSAYDISCNLASTGRLLAKQVGSTLYLGYLLTNNTVSFAATSPGTCRAGHGSPVCPNDPRFTVHFATEIIAVVRTPSLCQLHAESGGVDIVSASIDASNAAAEVAKLFGGQQFVAAEVAITNAERAQPLPLDAALQELRTSDACTGKAPGAAHMRTAFRDLEAVIDLRDGIILEARHAGIEAPSPSVPDPFGAPSPRVPSFTRPLLATAQPLVTAGNAVQARGQHFPPNLNLATALPVTLQHGGYGPGSIVLGGVCFGGATELEWGPVGGPRRVERLPGDAQGRCAARFDATNLTPSTAYQLRARDCDSITCSPWSPTLRVTTARLDDHRGRIGRTVRLGSSRGRVVLTLDGATPLGTATLDDRGTFETSITIPPGTSAGAHTIRAVSGDAQADAIIQVAAPAGERRASLMMVGLLQGETGCPNRPISSTQTDATFMLFGAGFAPGTVTIHLDAPTGPALETAQVRADGSICHQMKGVPGDKAGAHALVAAQNGAAVAQTAVTFVVPSVVR